MNKQVTLYTVSNDHKAPAGAIRKRIYSAVFEQRPKSWKRIGDSHGAFGYGTVFVTKPGFETPQEALDAYITREQDAIGRHQATLDKKVRELADLGANYTRLITEALT